MRNPVQIIAGLGVVLSYLVTSGILSFAIKRVMLADFCHPLLQQASIEHHFLVMKLHRCQTLQSWVHSKIYFQ